MTSGSRHRIDELLTRDYAWTPRQRRVLDLIARGRSNRQVAEELGISVDGAKWHMREILSKLGVESREEAAEYWRRHNGWPSRLRSWLPTIGALGLPKLVAFGAAAAVLVVTGVGLRTGLLSESAGSENEVVATEETPATDPADAEPVLDSTRMMCDWAYCVPGPQTLEELLHEAQVVAVVTVLERLPSNYSSPVVPLSRFRVRVDEVLDGDLSAGEEVAISLLGAPQAESGNPWVADGMQPRPGEPVLEVRWADYPLLQVGRREVLFLNAMHDHVEYRVLNGPGRHRLQSGRLAPLFADNHPRFDELAPPKIREALTGKTPNEARTLIASLRR